MSMPEVPFVSVIIPVYNEGRYIACCLQPLLRDPYPPDRYEIIIADGMSDDNTRAEIVRVTQGAAMPVIVLSNPRRVTPCALNLALAQARGEIIIRIDAHAEFGEAYITRCVAVMQGCTAGNVGGPLTSLPGVETDMARAIAFALSHPFGVGNSSFRTATEAQEVDTVAFGCFRADVFRRLGLFDERLWRHQDYEMNQRIRRAGGTLYMDPRLAGAYYCRPTLRALLAQAWDNGWWNTLAQALHPAIFNPRHAITGLFALGLLAAAVLLACRITIGLPVWLHGAAWGIWMLYLCYLALDLVVATRLSAHHGWRYWSRLVVIFPLFHTVYGAGNVCGWLRALLRLHPWQPGDGIPAWDERRRGVAAERASEGDHILSSSM